MGGGGERWGKRRKRLGEEQPEAASRSGRDEHQVHREGSDRERERTLGARAPPRCNADTGILTSPRRP
jgi:hypothetical protein